MITAHRRENIVEPMRNMFRTIKRIIDETADKKVIYPSVVREAAQEILGDTDIIRIVEPIEILDFHNFL